MRQFREPGRLLAALVVAAVLLGATLLAVRTQAPPPVAVSPTPTATPSPTTAPPTPTASPTPTAAPTPSPTPSARPSRAFLEPLRVDGVALPATLTTVLSLAAAGTARSTITVTYTDASAPLRAVPAFTIRPVAQSDMPGAASELEISIPNATDATTVERQVEVGPVRSIAVGSAGQLPAKVYRLGLDDHPLWRAMVLFAPTRIVIDVGAPPGSVSADGNTAVYQPEPGADVARAFHLSGAARAFEATYLWRVRDTNGTVVAGAPGVASIGTSALWGSIDMDVTLPATVSGNATLEVYQVSPKDGSEVSRVTVPLHVRP